MVSMASVMDSLREVDCAVLVMVGVVEVVWSGMIYYIVWLTMDGNVK